MKGVVVTATRKEGLLTRLKLRMEQRRLALVNYRPLITELSEQRYAYAQEGAGVRLRFSHSAQDRDDMLWGLALAIDAAETGTGVVIPL